jgi:hypothetical protein
MSLSQLKQALGAVARPNKYRINFSIPAAVPVKSDLSNADVLCKATSFPSMTIDQMEDGGEITLVDATEYGAKKLHWIPMANMIIKEE